MARCAAAAARARSPAGWPPSTIAGITGSQLTSAVSCRAKIRINEATRAARSMGAPSRQRATSRAAVGDRDRRNHHRGIHGGLESSGPERVGGRLARTVGSGKHQYAMAAAHRSGDPLDLRGQAAGPIPINEDRARSAGQGTDEWQPGHIGVRDRQHRTRREENENVEPGHVIGNDQRRSGPRTCPLRKVNAQRAQEQTRRPMQRPHDQPPSVVTRRKTGQHDPQGANRDRASDQQPPGDHRDTELVWTTTVGLQDGSGMDRSALLVILAGADQ